MTGVQNPGLNNSPNHRVQMGGGGGHVNMITQIHFLLKLKHVFLAILNVIAAITLFINTVLVIFHSLIFEPALTFEPNA